MSQGNYEWAKKKGYLSQEKTAKCRIHKITYEIRFGCPKCNQEKKANNEAQKEKPEGIFDHVVWLHEGEEPPKQEN